MTRNPFDALCCEAPRRPDAHDEIEDLIDESVLTRAMPAWGEEVWQDGRISNGEIVEWASRYGCLPTERLRTEICVDRVKSTNPGYCYKCAGWVVDRVVRGKLYLWAPERVI